MSVKAVVLSKEVWFKEKLIHQIPKSPLKFSVFCYYIQDMHQNTCNSLLDLHVTLQHLDIVSWMYSITSSNFTILLKCYYR